MSTQLLLTQAAGSGGGAAGFLMLVPYLLIFAVFWFFLIRPQQVRAKEHRAKVAAVKPRDQVVTGGGIVAFELKGGQAAAWKLIDATKLLSITANLGDTKTTITHPATTTHSRMTAEQRAAAGIGDGLVRIAVGLESVADIQADLARGLA